MTKFVRPRIAPLPVGSAAQCFVCKKSFTDEREYTLHRDPKRSTATTCTPYPKPSKPSPRFIRCN